MQWHIFSTMRLLGSWDDHGRYSEQWTETGMREFSGEDGCPAFTAEVELDEEEAGRNFFWGVKGRVEDRDDQWCIVTEMPEPNPTRKIRSFKLAQNTGDQEYFFSQSRHLGARKFFYPDRDQPGIRFGVWAPNAKKVEVVMARLWDHTDEHRTPIVDPNKTPAVQPIPHSRVAGGYIGDDGSGILEDWGPFDMYRTSPGIWYTDPEEEAFRDFAKFDHAPYMYRITTREGKVLYRTDLYSLHQIGSGSHRPSNGYTGPITGLGGTVSCSIVIDPDTVTGRFDDDIWPPRNWIPQHTFWDKADKQQPVVKKIEDLVIYELHVGALGFGKPEDEPGTLGDAVEFLGYLEELGVNAIELLPMSEYAGNAGEWGYSTSHYFAIEYSGGGREKYKWFIRACHERGIAVIIDVLYNHFIHDAERSEWMYDTTRHVENPYYWYEGHPEDYSEFNSHVGQDAVGTGGYIDNLSTGWAPRYYEEHVRKMFISSAIALITDFHVDGFRVDQTSSIHAYNVLHATGDPVPRANLFGQKLLRELTAALKLINPDVFLIAEDHTGWDKVTEEQSKGGLGFDLTWYSDYYHHLVGDTDKGDDFAKLIHTAGTGYDGALAMDYFAEALRESREDRVVYHQSHDEAGNGKYTDRNIRTAANGTIEDRETYKYAEARCRFAAGITLLSAGVPMFLFGEEVLARKKFIYGKVLQHREDYRGSRKNRGRNHFAFYQHLIRFRLQHSAIRSKNIEVVYVHNENRIIAFRRWSEDGEYLVIGSLNNKAFKDPGYTIECTGQHNTKWEEVFNSDAESFGGSGLLNKDTILSKDGFLKCILPSNGVVVLQNKHQTL